MQAEKAYEGLGTWKTFTKIVRTDGPLGLYRGCIPPLFGSGMFRAIQFAVFEALYTRWDGPTASAEIPASFGLQPRVIAAGFIASTVRAAIETPVEVAKIRRQTGQTYNWKCLFQGLGITWARTSGLMMTYFIIVDSLRRNADWLWDSSLGHFVVSGGAATL